MTEPIQVGNGEGLTDEQEKRHREVRKKHIIADFALEVSDNEKIQMMRGKHIDIYLEAEQVILARGDRDIIVEGIHPNTPGFSALCYILQENISTPVRFTVKNKWKPRVPVVTKLITVPNIPRASIEYGQKKDTFNLVMEGVNTQSLMHSDITPPGGKLPKKKKQKKKREDPPKSQEWTMIAQQFGGQT